MALCLRLNAPSVLSKLGKTAFWIMQYYGMKYMKTSGTIFFNILWAFNNLATFEYRYKHMAFIIKSSWVHLLIALILMYLIIRTFLPEELTRFMCASLNVRYKVLIVVCVFSNHPRKINSGWNGLLAGTTKVKMRKTKS